MKLIDKSALVAEIEGRIKVYQKNFDKTDNKITRLYADGMMLSLKSFLAFLNTFEVKEVDLEKEIKRWKNEHGVYGMDDLYFMFAKHFFELGLQARTDNEHVSEEQVKESAETQHVNETCKEKVNSLTQVHASEDLENAAIEICSKVLTGETINIDGYEYVVLSDAEECFKAGANWQKEKTIAKAIDAHCFGFQGDALFSFRLPADNYLVGSKVKVIIYK